MGKICREFLFITSEDLESFDNFSKRLEVVFECANQVGLEELMRNYFPTENMIEVGNVISPNALDGKSFQTPKEEEQNNNDIKIRDQH